jgi:hypothetical protein
MVLRRVRIWSFDLYEAFRADRLVAAACFVKVWRVVEEANGALGGVAVEEGFEGEVVDVGIARQLDFGG